jgi:MinD-like ATPase involved in chromosome partitioning or flagellar assembly/uncharacterized protein YjbI with pentapeptide repeats
MFSRWTRNPHEKITAARLLRNDLQFNGQCRDTIRVKENLIFIPAASPEEEPWVDPRQPNLRTFVADVRGRIMQLATQCRAKCVVIDCFCGVDLLTTAAASIADHTLLINEPDIITFTGTINLIFHLKRAFQKLERVPRLHIVVNRLRYTQTVASLTELYRDNLQEVVQERVLAYLPYHPRIFENFGKYPFVSDLLPRSLFVRKLKLIGRELFHDSHPELIPSPAEKWSRWKREAIYARSIDPSAVNADFLVLKFTRFPLLLGLWFLFRMFVLTTFPLTPNAAWLLRTAVEALLWVIAIPLLRGTWLAARLNFSLAALRARLGRFARSKWERTYHFATSLSALAAGALMAIAMVGSFFWMLSNLYVLAQRFGLDIRHPGSFHIAQETLIKGMLDRSGDVHFLDLRDVPVEDLDLSDRRLIASTAATSRRSLFYVRTEILINDRATLRRCRLGDHVLTTKGLSKVKFDHCSFTHSWIAGRSGTGPATIADQEFEGCNFENSVFRLATNITGGTFRKCTFRFYSFHEPIIIQRSQFEDCTFGSGFFAAPTKIEESTFNGCSFDAEGGTLFIQKATLENVRLKDFPKQRAVIFSNSVIKNSHFTLVAGTRVAFISCETETTKLENPSSEKCPLFVSPPEPSPELVDATKFDSVDEKTFVKRLELTLLEDLQGKEEEFRKIQNKDSDEYRSKELDLIETEILANTERTLREAKAHLAEALQLSLNAHDVYRVGCSLMLRVIFTIVTANQPLADISESSYEEARADWNKWSETEAWKQYHKNHPRLVWLWEVWDRYAPSSLNPVLTIEQLKKIDDIKASGIQAGLAAATQAEARARAESASKTATN